MSFIKHFPVCVCIKADSIPLSPGKHCQFSIELPDTVLHSSCRLTVNLLHQLNGDTIHLSRWDTTPQYSNSTLAFEWNEQSIHFQVDQKLVTPQWAQWHLLPDSGTLLARFRILPAHTEETLFRHDIAVQLQPHPSASAPSANTLVQNQAPVVRLVAINAFSRDAIGNFLFSTAQTIRDAGFTVQIYAAGFDPVLSGISGQVRHVSRVFEDISTQDILFYHASGYDTFLPVLSDLPVPKAYYYHNVTPASFFSTVAPEFADQLSNSIAQLKLSQRFDIIAANSNSSILELAHHTGALPPEAHIIPPVTLEHLSLFSFSESHQPALYDDSPYLLYVGQLAPHKQVDKLFILLEALHQQGEDIQLAVVGQCSYPAYQEHLDKVIYSLPEKTAQRITMLGGIGNKELAALYTHAKAFITLSEHEGFCVPLIEAMMAGIPVFSRDIPACKETLQMAGVILSDTSPALQAERIINVLRDNDALADLQANSSKRIDQIIRAADGRPVISLIHHLTTQIR
jgi:glycosyltransferase involved in cell wall biosynthesis